MFWGVNRYIVGWLANEDRNSDTGHNDRPVASNYFVWHFPHNFVSVNARQRAMHYSVNSSGIRIYARIIILQLVDVIIDCGTERRLISLTQHVVSFPRNFHQESHRYSPPSAS